jgi:hypothetical protein
VLHATSANGPIDIPVTVVPASKKDRRDVLGVLWARSRMGGLEVDLASGDAGAQATITKLGLDFGIVTRFTSFIAVDLSRRSQDGTPTRVVQPSDAPDGVDLESAGGAYRQPLPTSPGSARGGMEEGAGDQDDARVTLTSEDRLASAPPSAERGGCASCRAAGDGPAYRSGTWWLLALGLFAWLRRGASRRRPASSPSKPC